jgi:hypothetical protein
MFDVVALYRARAHHNWPLTARDERELRAGSGEGAHFLRYPRNLQL